MRFALPMLILFAGPALAQQATVILRDTVTGNREQPRVLYLVPWQQPPQPGFEYDLQGSFDEQLFAPVERAEFIRTLRYRELMAGEADTAKILSTRSNTGE